MKNPFSMDKTYRKVYIVEFRKGIQFPVFDPVAFDKLGKWFKKQGETWVCESPLTLLDFKNEILENLSKYISENDIIIKEGTWPIAVLGV